MPPPVQLWRRLAQPLPRQKFDEWQRHQLICPIAEQEALLRNHRGAVCFPAIERRIQNRDLTAWPGDTLGLPKDGPQIGRIMKRRIEQRDIRAFVRQRKIVERRDDALYVRRSVQEGFGSAQTVDLVVPNIERDCALAFERHAVAKPTVACAEIQHGERAARPGRCQAEHLGHEGVESSGANSPLVGMRPAFQVGQFQQVPALVGSSLARAVEGVFMRKQAERRLRHTSVRTNR